MQIFVIVLVVVVVVVVVVVFVVFVVSCNWFFPANHYSVSVLFLFTCMYSLLHCIPIVARGFPAHAYT